MSAVRLLLASTIALALACVSTTTERRLGEQEQQKVERDVGLSDHSASNSYVASVGRRLAGFAGRKDVPYRFHVVDMDVPNAFALPGGPVYISRGLLALIESEDELAGVLAHEIAHIEARHAARRIQASTPFAILNAPAKVLGSVAPNLGRLAELPSALAGGLAISAYSRQQEHEADKIGARIVAQAGFQPLALASALEALEKDSALHEQSGGIPTFLSTHPSTPDRVSKVRKLASELSPGPRSAIAADRSQLLGKLDGLVLGKNPKHGAFVGDSYVHPELGAALTLPDGWKHRRLPQALVSIAPDTENVGVIVQLEGQGTDPVAAAKARGLGDAQIEKGKSGTVNGLPAFQYAVASPEDALALTWIAFRNRVFLMSGRSRVEDFERFSPIFAGVFSSFRRATAQDLAGVRVQRLRIRSATEGESLTQFVRRTESAWKPEKTAIANRLDPATPLQAGQTLKVAIREPLTPGR